MHTQTHTCPTHTPQATVFSSSIQKATKQMLQHLGASCGSKTPQTTQSHSYSPAPHSCLLWVQENLQSRPWKNCLEHHRPSLWWHAGPPRPPRPHSLWCDSPPWPAAATSVAVPASDRSALWRGRHRCHGSGGSTWRQPALRTVSFSPWKVTGIITFG